MFATQPKRVSVLLAEFSPTLSMIDKNLPMTFPPLCVKSKVVISLCRVLLLPAAVKIVPKSIKYDECTRNVPLEVFTQTTENEFNHSLS